jgi:hypothetical protein
LGISQLKVCGAHLIFIALNGWLILRALKSRDTWLGQLLSSISECSIVWFVGWQWGLVTWDCQSPL